MAIVFDSDAGTVTGLSVGGLPDGIVDAGTLATNSVDSAELVDGAVDASHLASGINKTSISDSGNATAITIDSVENVGIGVTPESWTTTGNHWKVLQLGDGASIAGRTASGNVDISSNAYRDSTDNRWEYIGANGSEEASKYTQYDGQHVFYTASAGSADAEISFDNRLTVTNTGGVGISQGTPQSDNSTNIFLHIGSSASPSSGLVLENGQDGNLQPNQWEISSEEALVIRDGSTKRMKIYSGGEIDLKAHGGTSSGGDALYVNSGGRLGTSTSLRSAKGNIEPISNALELINKFEPVTFNYKKWDTNLHSFTEELEENFEAGMIVDDIQDFASDFNSYNEDGNYIGIRYHLVVPYLVSALQEAVVKIEELTTRIETLENT